MCTKFGNLNDIVEIEMLNTDRQYLRKVITENTPILSLKDLDRFRKEYMINSSFKESGFLTLEMDIVDNFIKTIKEAIKEELDANS